MILCIAQIISTSATFVWRTQYVFRILKLLRGGLVNKWKTQHWPKSQCQLTDTRAFHRTFTLADMLGNFCLVFIGVFVAFGVLLVECGRRPLAATSVCRANGPRLDGHMCEDTQAPKAMDQKPAAHSVSRRPHITLVWLNRLTLGCVTSPRRQSSDFTGVWMLSVWAKQWCHLTDTG